MVSPVSWVIPGPYSIRAAAGRTVSRITYGSFEVRMYRVFCDFDGTITQRDTIVFLTERLGGGTQFREEIFQAITSGRLSVFEAIARELATITASWDAAADLLRREVPVDPTFEPFVSWCRSEGHPVEVVSSGMEPVVRMFVGHLGIPVHAHPVEFHEEGWIYRRDPERDKVAVLQRAPRDATVVFVGDGTSDVPAVPWADRLFAKDYLADHCRRHSIPFTEFDNFDDVRDRIR